MKAALAAGARRYVTQSIAFLYAPEGGLGQGRGGAPLRRRAAAVRRGRAGDARPRARGARAPRGSRAWSSATASSTAPAPTTTAAARSPKQVSKRMLPVIGPGTGIASFIHVEDAAAATVAALDRGAPGIYNVVDDEPGPAAASGCRSTPRRSAPSRRAGCRPGSRGWSAAGRRSNSASTCAAPPTPRPSASWAGSRATRAGGRAFAKRSPSALPRISTVADLDAAKRHPARRAARALAGDRRGDALERRQGRVLRRRPPRAAAPGRRSSPPAS